MTLLLPLGVEGLVLLPKKKRTDLMNDGEGAWMTVLGTHCDLWGLLWRHSVGNF